LKSLNFIQNPSTIAALALLWAPLEIMQTMKKLLFLAILPVFLAGCSSITNLTPSQYSRNSTGYYPVEAAWNTHRQAVRPESFKTYVVVGKEALELRPVPKVSERWEGVVPVAPDQTEISYQFKFDYKVNAFGGPRAETKLSPAYKLTILDKK
jgi:hypothetical protein